MSTVDKLLIGVTVGAIFGILYAPDKGSITRRRLSRTGNELRNKLNDFRDTINDKIDSLKEDADDLAYQEMVILQEKSSAQPDTWQS